MTEDWNGIRVIADDRVPEDLLYLVDPAVWPRLAGVRGVVRLGRRTGRSAVLRHAAQADATATGRPVTIVGPGGRREVIQP